MTSERPISSGLISCLKREADSRHVVVVSEVSVPSAAMQTVPVCAALDVAGPVSLTAAPDAVRPTKGPLRELSMTVTAPIWYGMPARLRPEPDKVALSARAPPPIVLTVMLRPSAPAVLLVELKVMFPKVTTAGVVFWP